MSASVDAALAEVLAFHEAVTAWFGPSPTDAAWHRMQAAIHESFRIVGPDGVVHDRAGILAKIDSARGIHAGMDPPFVIAPEARALRWAEGQRVVVTYVEAQRVGGLWTRRQALAAFLVEPTAPLGVQWTDVAETWIAA